MDTNIGADSKTEPGDTDTRKLRKKRRRHLFGNVCYEFTQSTSLQGIPFTTREGLTIVERIFWIITIIVSLIMCGYLIEDTWTKWQTSPVIVTVSEQLVPVIKVPLPSITICPQAKCKLTVYNYTGILDKYVNHYREYAQMSLEERIKWAGVTLLCDKNMFAGPKMLRQHNSTAVKYINEVALNFGDVFHLCNINEKHVQCDELFSKTLTASGICYTMNALAAEEILRMENIQKDFSYINSTRNMQNWSIQHGYLSGFNSDVYPIRGLASDVIPTVSITFRQRLTDHDALCHGSSSGFQIHVQHPADLPQTSLYTHSLMVDQQAALALTFNIMNTSETLRNYDPEVRQCYFPEDRQLKYFKIYTAKNCRLECLSNFTLATCGCVPFYIPHNNSEQICGVVRRFCVAQAQETLAQREADDDAASRCKCLESCNSITYDAQLMKNGHYQTFDKFPSLKSSALQQTSERNLTRVQYSTLKIFYKSPQFISMRRSELFGVTDFLANCGGLLGLFLGFSFLSLVEIFYFFTLRLCCTLRKNRKQESRNELAKTDGHELTEECLPSLCERNPKF